MKDEDIPQMRLDLAEFEAENLTHGETIDILIYGTLGYAEMEDEVIRKHWKRVFLSIYYFIKLIFIAKEYDVVFVSSTSFNRDKDGKNNFFKTSNTIVFI